MGLENNTMSEIVETEDGFLRAKQIEAEKLKAANEAVLDQFAMKAITNGPNDAEKSKSKKQVLFFQQQTLKEDNESQYELDPDLKRDLERVPIEIQNFKEKEYNMLLMTKLVQQRRDELVRIKEELAQVKKVFPYVNNSATTESSKIDAINYRDDGVIANVDINPQYKKNIWLSQYYLDSRLRFGNLCMKIVAILEISCDKDCSDGFAEYVAGVYSNYLSSPMACSQATVEQLTPKLHLLLEDSERQLGVQIVHWLLFDTGVGAFLPLKEITGFFSKLEPSPGSIDVDNLFRFFVGHAYWFLQHQITTIMQRYERFLKRLLDEIEFKKKPKQFRNIVVPSRSIAAFKDTQKRLARALVSRDPEILNGAVKPHSLVLGKSMSSIQSPSRVTPNKSNSMLFRIANGPANRNQHLQSNTNLSESKELSTSVTNHSSKRVAIKGDSEDITSRTFKVLISQYHQSIRGGSLGSPSEGKPTF